MVYPIYSIADCYYLSRGSFRPGIIVISPSCYNHTMADKDNGKSKAREAPVDFEPYEVELSSGATVLIDGVNYRQLSNGVVQDPSTGRFLAQPKGGADTNITSPEQASAVASLRYKKYAEAAERGAAAGAGRSDSVSAWGRIIEVQTELAVDKDAGRTATEAAKFVGRAIDALPDKSSNSGTSQQSGVNIAITGDIALKILELVRDRDRESLLE